MLGPVLSDQYYCKLYFIEPKNVQRAAKCVVDITNGVFSCQVSWKGKSLGPIATGVDSVMDQSESELLSSYFNATRENEQIRTCDWRLV